MIGDSMRRLTILTTAILALMVVVATASLVSDAGKAPYYNDLAAAQAAAADDQLIAVDYYTDW